MARDVFDNENTIPVEVIPTDSTRNNPSFVFTRNASGYITSIVMTIGVTTFTKTITRDGSNYITGISIWT